jgi:hypothetical protein
LRAQLRPETKLLFLTAWGPTADASIVELAPRIKSWPWFIAVAELERATRVAWERFVALGVQPDAQAGGLHFEQLATIAAFRAEHLRARMHETLDVLDREGIHVVLLKGAALASTVYPSFIDRPMGDLDLLVPPEDARRAHKIVQAAGWRWDQATFPFSRYAGHHHLPPLDDAEGTGVRLELHTGIASQGHPFSLDLAALRAHGRTLQIGSTTATVPSTEHLLLHEAVHFAWSHVLSFGAWRTARDVQRMSRVATLNWEVFVDETRRHRAESCAYWTLVLSRLLAGAEIPDSILARIKPPVGSLAQRILERHFIYHLLPIDVDWPSQRLRRSMWEKAMQPERYGHGTTRPWQFDDRRPEPAMPASAETDEPPPSPNPMARLGRWARYVRALS